MRNNTIEGAGVRTQDHGFAPADRCTSPGEVIRGQPWSVTDARPRDRSGCPWAQM